VLADHTSISRAALPTPDPLQWPSREPQGRDSYREANCWSGTAAPEALSRGIGVPSRSEGTTRLVLVGFQWPSRCHFSEPQGASGGGGRGSSLLGSCQGRGSCREGRLNGTAAPLGLRPLRGPSRKGSQPERGYNKAGAGGVPKRATSGPPVPQWFPSTAKGLDARMRCADFLRCALSRSTTGGA
jgi:hypothetical protein